MYPLSLFFLSIVLSFKYERILLFESRTKEAVKDIYKYYLRIQKRLSRVFTFILKNMFTNQIKFKKLFVCNLTLQNVCFHGSSIYFIYVS